SRKAKIFFLIAFVLLVVCFAVQFMTGLWLNLNTLLMYGAGTCVIGAIFFDRNLYWEFFTMRTTKHGMNMGLSILIVIVLLVCVNYLAALHGKSWDVTQEKLNSLSDESANVM